MKNRPTLGVIGIAKKNHPKEEIKKFLQFYKDKASHEKDVEILVGNEVFFDEKSIIKSMDSMRNRGADLFLLCVGSWVYSSVVISSVNDLHENFILYGLSEKVANGNIGAALQIKYVLREMGHRFLFKSGLVEDEDNYRCFMRFSKAPWVANQLRNRNIGVIGGKCMMMYQTQVNEFNWKRVFGVDFSQYDSVQVFSEMENINDAEAHEVEKKFLSRVKDVHRKIDSGEEIVEDAVLTQAKMYLAFKRLKELYNIDIFANKCLPEMTTSKFGYEYAACLATCLLNEDGITTACEADVPAALSMYILSLLSGERVFFADIARLNKKDKCITFFNCGSGPVSMADTDEDISLWPIPALISDEAVPNEYYTGHMKGACIHFDLKKDKVITAMRIGGNNETLRFHVARAKTVKRDKLPDEMPSIRWPGFTLEFTGNLDTFLNNTTGHHYAIVYGDYVTELEYLSEIYGIGVVVDE